MVHDIFSEFLHAWFTRYLVGAYGWWYSSPVGCWWQTDTGGGPIKQARGQDGWKELCELGILSRSHTSIQHRRKNSCESQHLAETESNFRNQVMHLAAAYDTTEMHWWVCSLNNVLQIYRWLNCLLLMSQGNWSCTFKDVALLLWGAPSVQLWKIKTVC